MENNLYTEKKNGIEVSLYAITEGNEFAGISFPCVSKDNKGVNMMIEMTKYGLKNDYQGEDKETIDALLKKIENKLKKDFGLTFEQEPQPEPMVELQEEEEQ